MVKKVQGLEAEAMRRFRVERKEKRPDGAIEHAAILQRRWRNPGSGTDFVLLQAAPAAVDETFDRLKVQEKGVVLDAKAQSRPRVLQPLVPCLRAPLAAGSAKLLDGDAHRDAGAAVVAIRSVGKDAAAAKAEPYQVRVQLGSDQMAGGRDLRARHPARQIAARVGRSHVELQYCMRQIVQLRHGTCAAPDQLPGECG